MKKYLVIIYLTALVMPTLAQKSDKIKYKADDFYEYSQNGVRLRRLTGNVVFTQKTSMMFCDSALFHVKENTMEAFGEVVIEDDSVTITAKKLIYDGNNRTAKLREEVVYQKGEQMLFTDFLNYEMDTEIGNYQNSGTLKDSTNTLVSETGYFYGKEKYALFWDNVKLTAPDYTLTTDTLRYNTITKVVNTEGKTVIVTPDETMLHAKGGEFRTQQDQSLFIDGEIETEDYYLEADDLFFDDLRKIYNADGNVRMTAKNNDIIITGDHGYNDKKAGISKVYGNALMMRILKKDTFYLAADTLVSIESKVDSLKRVLAYHQAKMWRYNLQGLSDSIAYFLKDSMVYFYQDPIFWHEKNQITADTVFMEIKNQTIETMSMRTKAFMVSEDTSKYHNQISGRNMKAYFTDSEIDYMDVNGNGESIYYVLDNTKNNFEMMGMNRILCSNMRIRFKDSYVDNISFYIKPEAKFIPPHELKATDERLQNYTWRAKERPELDDLTNPEKRKPKQKEIPKKEEKATLPEKTLLKKPK